MATNNFGIKSTIGWSDVGMVNRLQIRPGTVPQDTRVYSDYLSTLNNTVLFKVTSDGRVIRDGIDITDNDAAMAQCFVDYLKFKSIEVKRDHQEIHPQAT